MQTTCQSPTPLWLKLYNRVVFWVSWHHPHPDVRVFILYHCSYAPLGIWPAPSSFLNFLLRGLLLLIIPVYSGWFWLKAYCVVRQAQKMPVWQRLYYLRRHGNFYPYSPEATMLFNLKWLFGFEVRWPRKFPEQRNS